MKKLLPFDYEFAKYCVARANAADKKAKDLSEVFDTAQMMFVQFGLLEAPHREGKQNAITNKLQSLCCKFTEMKKPLQQIFNSYRMEDWDKEDLRLWLSETAWIVKERERAEKLLHALK